MKYVKLFDTETEYTTYKASEDYVVPNVSYIKETEGVEYDPYEEKTYVFEASPIEEVSIEGELTRAKMGDTITSVNIPSGYTSINLQGMNKLEEVTIPNTVTSIKFKECESLKRVDLPNSVTSIQNSAFDGCTSLTSVTIGDGVTSIGINAFQNCRSLTDVTIGSGVTSIGSNAFSVCSSLTSIDIPDSVTSIGNSAFRSCSNLTSVTIKATNPPTLGTSVFENNVAHIYVPAASVEAYKTAWSTYASRIEAIPNS